MKKGSAGPLFRVPGLSYLGMRKRRNPVNGIFWEMRWMSAASNDPSKPSPAETGFNLVPSSYSAEVEAIGAKHVLTVSSPDDPTGGTGGLVSTTYEVLGNSPQKDLREHPKALALYGGGQAAADAMRRITVALYADEKDRAKYEAPIIANGGDELILYLHFKQRNGSASFQISQFVYRVSAIVSNTATYGVAYSNNSKLYTTAQVLAETKPPTGILASVVDAAEKNTPASIPIGYAWTWLKQSPTVTTEAGFKVRVTLEYWLELWSTWIYPAAS